MRNCEFLWISCGTRMMRSIRTAPDGGSRAPRVVLQHDPIAVGVPIEIMRKLHGDLFGGSPISKVRSDEGPGAWSRFRAPAVPFMQRGYGLNERSLSRKRTRS